MSHLWLTMAVVGAIGMWTVVVAFWVLAATCLRALCARSCTHVLYDFIRRLGGRVPAKEEPNWTARLIVLAVGGNAKYVGIKGVPYMVQTTYYVCTLMAPSA
jgi:hypothetical protein